MRLILSVAVVLGAFVAMSQQPSAAETPESGDKHEHECALDYKMNTIDGKKVDLEDYEGNVVLIVNTASQCGLTPHYKGLQTLYKKYEDKGFVVLGFPCNQFGSQEPGTDAEIAQFCSSKYDVTFPMFSKVDVNGDDAAPIFQHLTSKDVKPAGKGPVGWNFEKFLIDREGQLVSRFKSRTAPEDTELVKAIEAELQKK
ncbi:MAG: glutathione peroxidase [Pirellulaceae bacterium]|nr:glutathione peroxidase [Pirellulaceae bacterium]